jgi:8-oxo-dGTP pyrophosphatase MutT (NUDIX family)
MKFDTIHSQPIYQGRAFSVRKDQVRLPDGAETHLDIVEHIGAVTILPFDEDGNIWFVRQYRHAAALELLELPAGTLEPGEPPEICAHREIREEIGMRADTLQKIGEFYLAPGYSTEFMHIFLGTDLSPDPLEGDIDEFLQVEQIALERIPALIRAGEIVDAKTLAAFQLAEPYLPIPKIS